MTEVQRVSTQALRLLMDIRVLREQVEGLLRSQDPRLTTLLYQLELSLWIESHEDSERLVSEINSL